MILSNQKGFSLVEMLTASAIMVVIALLAVNVFTKSNESLYQFMEEAEAERNLLQAAYLLRSWGSQAVKSRCSVQANLSTNLSEITNSWPRPLDMATPAEQTQHLDLEALANVPMGVFDCRVSNPSLVPEGQVQPLALFVREHGGPTVSGPPASNYLATAVYFQPPSGLNMGFHSEGSGVLYFAQSALGGNLAIDRGASFYENLVSVHVVDAQTASPSLTADSNGDGIPEGLGPLQSVTYQIVARYFTGHVPRKDYRPGACEGPNALPCRDIKMTVVVPLRNNILTVNFTGEDQRRERLYGSSYFYRFVSPRLTEF